VSNDLAQAAISRGAAKRRLAAAVRLMGDGSLDLLDADAPAVDARSSCSTFALPGWTPRRRDRADPRVGRLCVSLRHPRRPLRPCRLGSRRYTLDRIEHTRRPPGDRRAAAGIRIVTQPFRFERATITYGKSRCGTARSLLRAWPKSACRLR
jgi:hypothetical protein